MNLHKPTGAHHIPARILRKEPLVSTSSRTLLATIATALVVGLAGCAAAPASSNETGDELVTVRAIDVLQSQKLQIAKDQGFFERHGINLEISQLATGTEIIAAVQGGSAEIGYADVYAGLNAINNGFDLRLVVSNNGHGKATPYLVKADSGLKTAADLRGKSLGLGGVPQFTVAARAFLEARGVQPDEVELVVIRQTGALPEALESGSVDAIQATWPQVYTNTGNGNGYDLVLVDDPDNASYLEPAATSAGFWSTGDWATANPGVAQQFADALREYNAWWNNRSVDELAALNKQYYDIDLLAISAGDPAALERLTKNDNLLEGPIDIPATLRWIETGLRYAPDQIPAGVDFEAHILPSAK